MHLEGLLDVHQKTFQKQRKPETDGEKELWILEQSRPGDEDDIVAMYNTTI